MRPSKASVIQYKADQKKAELKEVTVTYGQLEVLARMLAGVEVSAAASLSLDSLRKQVLYHLNATN